MARHAYASCATASVWRANETATVTVSDDGVGPADPAGGTELSGLAARVEALNRRLTSTVHPGGHAHQCRDPLA